MCCFNFVKSFCPSSNQPVSPGRGTSCGAGPGDPGAGRFLEAPEPMAEVVSSAFSHASMAAMLATKGKKCWNGFEDVLGEHVGI